MSFSELLGFGTAHTGTAGQHAQANGGVMSMLPMLAAFMFIFYFMMIRPQNKRAKAQRDLIGNLDKGDEVTTSAGLLGRIKKIDDGYVTLEIAKDVAITLQKSAIANVVPKGTLKH